MFLIRFSNKRYIRYYILGIILIIFSSFISVYIPSILGNILDKIPNIDNYTNLFKYYFLFLLLGVLIVLFNYLSSKTFNRINIKLNEDINKIIFQKLKSLNILYWEKQSVGEVFTIINNDVVSVLDYYTKSFPQLIGLFLSILLIFIYIIKTNIYISIILFSVNIILAYIQYNYNKSIKIKMKEFRDVNGLFNSKLNDILNNLEFLQIKNYCKSVEEDFYQDNRLLFKNKESFLNKIVKSSSINLITSTLSMLIILVIGGYAINLKVMSIGILVNLILYSQKIFSPLTNIIKLFIHYESIKPSISKIRLLLDDKNEISNGYNEIDNTTFTTLEIENLNLKFKDKDIFKNLNLRFEKSEIIGIIGKNGSGKSTLIKLIRKIIPTDEGKILLNKINIDEISYDSLIENISIMPQNIFINKNTIDIIKNKLKNYNNIDLINKFLGENKNLFDEIGNIKYKVDSNSLGELQKILFLETILNESNIYIFDEPSSAIDISSEKYMAQILKSISNNKIIIIITHREFLLNICNRIINLDEI